MNLKYELDQEVVKYLIGALNSVPIRGVKQAQSMLSVISILENPMNKEEIEKSKLQELKDKYEKPSEESQ